MIGVSAVDNHDTSLSISIVSSNVIKSVLGTYSVLYSTSDISGNTQSAYRTV